VNVCRSHAYTCEMLRGAHAVAAPTVLSSHARRSGSPIEAFRALRASHATRSGTWCGAAGAGAAHLSAPKSSVRAKMILQGCVATMRPAVRARQSSRFVWLLFPLRRLRQRNG